MSCTALHSNYINAALQPVTTKQRGHCSPCCSLSSGSSLSCFFSCPTQTDPRAVAPEAICSKAWSRFLALLLLLPLASALSPACFDCHCYPAAHFTGRGFVLHLYQQLTGALAHQQHTKPPVSSIVQLR